ncbi:4Fe-4S dicluster domain-containing protein [Nitratiruptor tergarcus]|uniref:Ferredoxin-type protein NapF n=1 Tax=Nitratiruptor tergarcus DSM 16512 TaxID=1069081 RepID=A0A1W1WRI0_9BACT|nr:4Fe-4S dicluster domain-containing protein [Nitratiruptor tergarcus]SMC08610.1 ferredoxin-type protein NapF [Nitratiruptor tergarcus DSM 16512]
MKRREFFTSLLKPVKQRKEEQPPLFPPYFNDIKDFEKCRECESKACVAACEEQIIVIVDAKPSLDFSKSGCTFCDACAIACEDGVLTVENKQTLPKLMIDMLGCLAWQKTICNMCKDVCLENAIEFSGLFNPQINDRCTGCGFCVGVCPTQAIKGGEG